MFDFPLNPASGTVVMVPDGSYRVWDSTKWRASPSSSTITTGPFLPTAGGVMTGALSLFGNATSALHAVPLQQLNAATAGGPFLPLATGGTVSGQLQLNVTRNLNGSSPTTPPSFWDILTISGTSPAGMQSHNQFNISDTLDVLTNNPGGAPMGVYISHQMSPPATGGRCALSTQLNVVGPTLNLGTNPWLLGFQTFAGSNANGGGTSGQSVGALVSFSFQTNLNAGATYYTMAEGFEGGIELFPGASADYVNGAKIVVVGQGRLSSNIITLDGGSAAAGSRPKMGISFQSLESPHWPIDPTGTMIGTHQGGTDPQTASLGVDLSAVTFSTAAFKSNGFLIDGSGNLTASAATFNGSLTMINNQQFAMGDAGGSPVTMSIGGDNHMLWYGTSSTGAQRPMMEMFQRSDTSSMNWQLPVTFVGAVTFYSTLTAGGNAAFNAGFTLGTGAGTPALHFNGGSSGTGAGPAILFEFGGTGRAALGGYSAVQGGAYDSRIVLHGYDGVVLAAQGLPRTFITATGMGFNGTAAVAKPTVSGAKGSNAALASLLSALAAYGLVTDTSTA